MSAGKIHDVGPPEDSIQITTEEFRLDNTTPNNLTLTKRFPERSPEEKLVLLQDLIKRKYAL